MKSMFMIISVFLLAIQAQAGYSYLSVVGTSVDGTSVGGTIVAATSSTPSAGLSSATEVISFISDTSLPASSSSTSTFARHTTVTKHHTTSHHRPSHSWSFNGTLPYPLPTGGSVTPYHSHHKSSKGTLSPTTTSTSSSSSYTEIIFTSGCLPVPRPHHHTTKQPAHSKHDGPITFSGITIDLPWETVTLEPTTWTPPTITAQPQTVLPPEGSPPHAKRDDGADPAAQKKVKRDDDPSTIDVPTTMITLKTTVVSQNSTQQHHKTRPFMPRPVVTEKPHEGGGDDQKTKQPFLPKPVVPTYKDSKAKRIGVPSSSASATSLSGTNWATDLPYSLHCLTSASKTHCYCDENGHVLCSNEP